MHAFFAFLRAMRASLTEGECMSCYHDTYVVAPGHYVPSDTSNYIRVEVGAYCIYCLSTMCGCGGSKHSGTDECGDCFSAGIAAWEGAKCKHGTEYHMEECGDCSYEREQGSITTPTW